MTPLLTPVRIEVYVRPAPGDHPKDADNVVRDYLLPHILDVLEPPTALALPAPKSDPVASAAQSDPADDFWETAIEKIPASARVGVLGYDVWRLPARDDSDGFVWLSLTAAYDNLDGLLSRVNRALPETHD